MVKFGGKIGTLYQMLKKAFKKHPLQNRTNVQIKGGGGGQRPFEQCSKKLHFSLGMASLRCSVRHRGEQHDLVIQRLLKTLKIALFYSVAAWLCLFGGRAQDMFHIWSTMSSG